MGISIKDFDSLKKELPMRIEENMRMDNFAINTMQQFIGWIESLYTLRQLQNIISEFEANDAGELCEGSVNNLIDFLTVRWSRIQKTSSCYTQNSVLPANIICYEIAKKLATAEKSCWEYLMPTLTVKEYGVSHSTLFDSDFRLGNVLLSDDLGRIIEIEQIVESFAADPAHGFVHTSYFLDANGEETEQKLSEEEKKRLRSHHNSIEEYVGSLQKREDLKNNGLSLGSVLEPFILQLRKGGVKQQGEELDSGAAANEAIVAMASYINSLESDIKQRLMAARAGRYVFGDVWNQRLAPSNAQHKINRGGVVFCVEISASHLMDILGANSWLYTIVPAVACKIKGVDAQLRREADRIEKEVSQKKSAFQACIKNEQLKIENANWDGNFKTEDIKEMLEVDITNLPGFYAECAKYPHYFLLVMNTKYQDLFGKDFLEFAFETKGAFSNICLLLNAFQATALKKIEILLRIATVKYNNFGDFVGGSSSSYVFAGVLIKLLELLVSENGTIKDDVLKILALNFGKKTFFECLIDYSSNTGILNVVIESQGKEFERLFPFILEEIDGNALIWFFIKGSLSNLDRLLGFLQNAAEKPSSGVVKIVKSKLSGDSSNLGHIVAKSSRQDILLSYFNLIKKCLSANDICELLRSSDVNSKTFGHYVAAIGNTEITDDYFKFLQYLLYNGATVETIFSLLQVVDDKENTVGHAICQSKSQYSLCLYIKFLKYLLEQGVADNLVRDLLIYKNSVGVQVTHFLLNQDAELISVYFDMLQGFVQRGMLKLEVFRLLYDKPANGNSFGKAFLLKSEESAVQFLTLLESLLEDKAAFAAVGELLSLKNRKGERFFSIPFQRDCFKIAEKYLEILQIIISGDDNNLVNEICNLLISGSNNKASLAAYIVTKGGELLARYSDLLFDLSAKKASHDTIWRLVETKGDSGRNLAHYLLNPAVRKGWDLLTNIVVDNPSANRAVRLLAAMDDKKYTPLALLTFSKSVEAQNLGIDLLRHAVENKADHRELESLLAMRDRGKKTFSDWLVARFEKIGDQNSSPIFRYVRFLLSWNESGADFSFIYNSLFTTVADKSLGDYFFERLSALDKLDPHLIKCVVAFLAQHLCRAEDVEKISKFADQIFSYVLEMEAETPKKSILKEVKKEKSICLALANNIKDTGLKNRLLLEAQQANRFFVTRSRQDKGKQPVGVDENVEAKEFK